MTFSNDALKRWHDQLGAMIDQVGHPDYSLREMVDGMRQIRDEMMNSAQNATPASPLDAVALDEVRRIYELAKRDDWHLQLVGSDIRRLCRMALQFARSESATRPSEKVQPTPRVLTISELARVQDWLLRYVKDKDLDDVRALCYMATMGAIKLEAVQPESAAIPEGMVLVHALLLESASNMLEYGRCITRDDDAADKFEFFRDQLRLAATPSPTKEKQR